MTPEELETLTRNASVEHLNTVRTIVLLVCYGFYFPLCLRAVAYTIPKLKTVPASRFTLALLVILFITQTMHFASGIFIQITKIHWPTQGSPDTPLLAKIMLTNLLVNKANSVFITSGRFTLALIDVIIVWRAYVLWPESLKIRIILLGSLFLSIPYSLGLAIWEAYDAERDVFNPLSNKLDVLSVFLNFAINVLATGCIGYRAWMHYMSQRQLEKNGVVKLSSVTQILYLVVEGGIVLAAFQLVWAILAAVSVAGAVSSISSPAFLATVAFSELIIAVSAAYPSIITILLAEQKSSMDHTTFVVHGDSGRADFPSRKNRVSDEEEAQPRDYDQALSVMRFAEVPERDRNGSGVGGASVATDTTL